MSEAKKTGLELLREPFPANQISKLPKPTARQTEEVRKDFSKGIRCQVCGAWHHPKVVHLDYVGHAALTDRLLDCDPLWNWEPLACDERGFPAFDQIGGMWIKLTVCGVTRLGYGAADGKKGSDAIKEVIGDALRNSAMRFGAALDMWHKGDLHVAAEDDGNAAVKAPKQDENPDATQSAVQDAIDYLYEAADLADLKRRWSLLSPEMRRNEAVRDAARQLAEELKGRDTPADLDGDEIPY